MEPLRVIANGIDIAYESFGDPTHPPILLVMGLGTQMIGWPDEFCAELAGRDLHVVRFDNRDIGMSTHLSGLPNPKILPVLLRRRPPPYRIEDMAADTVALIETLHLGPVHLVGASMGGFIAQTVALRHQELVRTLTLIMTSTGSRRVGQATPKVMAAVLRGRPAVGREQAVAASMATLALIGSTGYPIDEPRMRVQAGRAFDRGYHPEGTRRQLIAAGMQADRSAALRRLTVPTLVMHGLADPLVNVSGGLALARTIPGAKFVGFAGMGHDLPQPLWSQFITEIVANAARAHSPA